MKSVKWKVLVILCLAAMPCLAGDGGFASWDKFFYNVGLPVKAVRPSGSVKVMVYHSYPTALTGVKLTPKGDAFAASVTPASMKKLNPTEIKSFVIGLKLKRSLKQDIANLPVELSADQLEQPKTLMLRVPLTSKGEKELASALAVPVGKMELEVRRWGYEIYYLYLLPMLLLLAWFLWRRRRFA